MLNGIFRNKRPAMFLFLIAGFIIGAYFILTSKAGLSSADVFDKFQQLLTGQITFNDKADDDHDGLTNGDEKKYGTDINKEDTDGDGYLDGEEILSGRDPLKAGPDDALTSANLTQIFNNALAQGLKNNFVSFDKIPADDLAKGLEQFLMPFVITTDQLKIISDNSQGTLDTYLAAVKNIIAINFDINRQITNTDDSTYKYLSRVSENTFNELKKMPVPSLLVGEHQKLLNTFLVFKNIADALTDENDPVKKKVALTALNLFLEE